MRYLTYQFAHLETLERARRWLVHAGFEPSQIETLTDGIPRLALRLHPGQAAEAGMVIDAVELTDPDGHPSFWEIARQPHIYPASEPDETILKPTTFVVGFHPLDASIAPNSTNVVTSDELREAYLGRQGL